MSEEYLFDFFNDTISESVKVLGGLDKNEYCKLIKRLYDKCSNLDNCIFLSNIPLNLEIPLMNYIKTEVYKFDLNNLNNEEIVLTNNDLYSYNIKNSLIENWSFVLNSPIFTNGVNLTEVFKKNILASIIISLTNIVNNFDFTNKNKPKIVYYGMLNNIDALSLRILNNAGFKIMYLNSQMDNEILNFKEIGLKEVYDLINLQDVLNIATELEKTTISSVKTIGKEYIETMSDKLFDGITLFRPKQIFHLQNKTIHIDCILEDVKSYIFEENRFRKGFRVENNIVYTPNFFIKINGVYNNLKEYKTLLSEITQNSEYKPFIIKENMNNLITKTIPQQSYSLIYSIKNFILDEEELKNNPYFKLKDVNLVILKRLFTKFNEYMYKHGLNGRRYSLEDFLLLLLNIFSSNKIINLLSNFDYPFKVPKLIVYIDKDYDCSKAELMYLEYLNTLGIDIVIISPYGNYYLENNTNEITTFLLDKIDYNFDIKELNQIKESKGFLRRIINWKE